jgi:putative glutamine amidotransferase
MGKPVIGITTRTYFIPQGGGEPHSEVNLAACAHMRAVAEAGGVPLLIPLAADEASLRQVLELLDGVVLSGGWDVDPGLYGEEPHRLLGTVDVRKDDTERLLAPMLLEGQMPVLAICRGAQMLNVAAGGTLHQDVSLAADEPLKHQQRTIGSVASHTIRIESGSRLAAIVGTSELRVNSRHHQCIAKLAARFVPTARASDGVLEAYEDPAHPFMLGVQCHPEDLTHEAPFAALFEALVQASARTPA